MKISKSILILFFIFYLFDAFTGGELSILLSLDIAKITNEHEYWRLFSYPLATGSFESTLLLIFSLGIFAPKLEERYKRYLLPFMIFLISLMHGVLYTWLFIYSDKVFAGSEGVSLFILISFLFSFRKSKFSLMGKLKLNSIFFILSVLTFWSCIQALKIFDYAMTSAVDSVLFAGMGIANSILLLLQVMIMNKINPIDNYKKDNIEDELDNFEDELSQLEKDELSLALIASQQRRYKEKQKDESYKISSDPRANEEKMNQILDKISDQGYPSLSPGEQKFLKEYSKILK